MHLKFSYFFLFTVNITHELFKIVHMMHDIHMGTYCLVANHRIQSVRMTENRWNSTQAAEEYPRLDTSVIPGSTRFAG